ncbi:hypothetical protein BT96DRAFT_1001057 [Gymnopus androsaceus JB14]|uniref:Uncharacterized protein n=1 Tax=Gymnopus androsaceus JB14 TaxID=1447944 RepID=A0A6A4H1Z1_9AGAR|nr:hypothetical protein BT96DRAFT_1001057 [Gymnopus androsaceus JB14]
MAPALPMVLVEKEFVAYKSIPVYLRYNPEWAPLSMFLAGCLIASQSINISIKSSKLLENGSKAGTTQFLIRQISNANKAKTRGGKARAKADPPMLVMESVVIPVVRGVKKRPQDAIDVPPAAPTSTLEVPAGKVDEFLNKIDNSIEAQLRPVFGRIMGLEPGEPETQRALGDEIDAAIAELPPVDAPQVKKAAKGKARGKGRKTTFKPSFHQEDSASRPPSNVPSNLAPHAQSFFPPESPPRTPTKPDTPEADPPSIRTGIWDAELRQEMSMASAMDAGTAQAVDERMSEYLEALETSTVSQETRKALTLETKKAFLSRFAAITREEVVPDTPESLVRLFKDLSLPLGGKEPSPSPIRQPYRTGGLASSSVPPSSPCPSAGYKVASGWSTLGDVEEEEEEEDEEHQEEEEDEEQEEEEEDEEQEEEGDEELDELEQEQEQEEDEEQDEQDEQEQEQVELEADHLHRRVDESREGLNETHPTPSRPPTLPDKPDQEMDRIAKARMARQNKLLELAGKKVPAPLPSQKSRASATAPTGSRKAANPREKSPRPAPPANGNPRDKSRSKTTKVVAVPTTRPPQNARALPKKKVPAPVVTNSNNDDNDDEEGEEGDSKNKGGRLSRSAIAQARGIRQKYHDDLQALADKEGKTFAAILSAVGDTVSDTRALNPWNAFQAYAMHPDGLGMTKGQDESTADLKKRIRAAYHKKCNGVDDVEEEFSEILEWYSTTIASQTAQKRLEGLSEKQLVKIAGPFNNRGRQVWETYQVSCFGWIVDGVSARAVAFGSDPYYLGMKEDNPSQMRDQCVDYGTMIHAQLMRKKQGALLDPRKQKIINKYLEDKTNKATLRALVKDIWIHDLQTLCPNSNITQMKWGSAFADMCYREKIKLVNYPRGLKAIGAPGGLQAVSGIEKNYLKTIVGDRVQFWQQEARESRRGAVEDEDEGMAPLYDDDSDEGSTSKRTVLLEEDLVRFVPWDENEKALSVADRANIGIVTQQPRGDEEPLVLTKVLHSKKYVEYARARSTKTVGREDSDEEDSDSQSDAPRESRQTKVGKSIAFRRERVQEGESSDEEDSDSESDAPRESRKTKVGRSIAVRRERVQEGESSDEEDSDSESDAPRESRKTKVGRSIAVRRERVQEGESDFDTSVAAVRQKKKTVAPRRDAEHDSDSAPVEPTRKKKTVAPRRDAEHDSDSAPAEPAKKKKTVAPRRDADHDSDSVPAEPAKKKKTLAPRRDAEHDSDSVPAEPAKKKKTLAPRRDAEHDSDSVPAEPAKKKKKTVAPRRDAEHDSDSAPAEPTKKKKTVGPRRDVEVDSDSVPTRLPKKIAGKGRDEERPRKRARLNREHGKKHGKEKNIADQSEVVGGQGRKRKRDEDAPRVIAQLSRPIVKLPKRKSGD